MKINSHSKSLIKNITIILPLLFIASTALRYLLAFPTKSITVYFDELIYLDIARSLLSGSVKIRNIELNFSQIFYPLVISWINIIKNTAISYELIKLFGAAAMSSALFPAYLLGRQLTGKKFYGLLIALIAVIIPEMYYSTFVLSEVVFFPLSLWFLLYTAKVFGKASKGARIKNGLIAGILMFGLLLTKIVSIYYPAAFLLMLTISLISAAKKKRKLFIFTTISMVAILIAALYGTISISSFYTSSLRGFALDASKIIYILYSVFIYIMFLIIASGFFPVMSPIMEFKYVKHKKFLVFTWLSFVCAFFLIAATILLKEEYPVKIPRIHFRYIFPLFIPLIAMFLNLKAKTVAGKVKIFFFVLLILFINIFLGVPPAGDSNLDAPIISHIIVLDASNFAFNFIGIKLKLAWFDLFRIIFTIFCIWGFISIYKNKNFKKLRATFLLFLVIFFTLSGFTSYLWKYKKFPPSKTAFLKEEAILINNYLHENPGETLILSSNIVSDKILETYISHPYYFTLKQNIIRQGENSDFIIDTLQNGIEAISTERGNVYEETVYIENIPKLQTSIKYVITGKNINNELLKSEKIFESNKENYSLYRINDNKIIINRKNIEGK